MKGCCFVKTKSPFYLFFLYISNVVLINLCSIFSYYLFLIRNQCPHIQVSAKSFCTYYKYYRELLDMNTSIFLKLTLKIVLMKTAPAVYKHSTQRSK